MLVNNNDRSERGIGHTSDVQRLITALRGITTRETKMTTLARRVLKQNDQDNMTLDRLVNRSGYQEIFAVQVNQDLDNEATIYIFADGSALRNSANNWDVITNYGLNADHEKYSNKFN